MPDSYYERMITLGVDGPLFACEVDAVHEREVAALLAQAWNCEIKAFGRLCPVDFFALRGDRLVGVLELKSRSHGSAKYPTVFLNVRKWLALKLAAYGLGCPGIFVVRFTDGVYFIPVDAVPVGSANVIIGGTREIVKSHTDIEPVFAVPVALLRRVAEPPAEPNSKP